jgi:NDP-sugar pyrophosphorylase family protein
MSAILICPSPGPAVERLASFAPLAAIPLMGESLVEYWLTHLALSGFRRVRILAHDRPGYIAAIAGDGARWGLQTEVIDESRDLTPAQAQIKYASRRSAAKPGSDEIIVVDHFPGATQPLFTCYSDLFNGLLEWLPQALMPDRVGVRELRPGIKVGWHTRISPAAQLHAPCWIGQSVYIGAGAVVGPMTVVEDRSFVEPAGEITGSLIGPDTFVGRSAKIQNSIAWGETLIDWKSGLCGPVPDAYLLCALRSPALARQSRGFFDRLAEIYSRNKDDLQMFWQFLINKTG